MKRIRHSSLSFREGSSDKLYEAELIELGPERYLVNFRYGKRGASLREGSKTPEPLPFEPAAKIYKSLLVEKLNKGYELQAGFDPFAGELKAPEAPAVSADPAAAPLTRAARVLALLQAYAAGEIEVPVKQPKARRGRRITLAAKLGQSLTDKLHALFAGKSPSKPERQTSLGRCIQLAGDLGLREAAPLLPGLIAPLEAPGSRVLNYTIAWALGRIADPESLQALPRLRESLPASHAYLLPEVELALSTPERRAELIEAQRCPGLESAEAFASLLAELAAYARYEALACRPLAENELARHQEVVALHDLSEALAAPFAAISLEQDWAAFEAGLAPELRAALRQSGDGNRFEALNEAVAALLAHHRHERKQALEAGKAADQALYKQAVAKLDLKRVIRTGYFRDYARNAQLAWIWGDDKQKLIQALQATGLIPDAAALCARLETLMGMQYIDGKPLLPGALSWTRSQLAEAGHLKELETKIAGLDLNELQQWNFYQHHLSPSLAAKIASDLQESVEALFEHHQALLRAQKLARRLEQVQSFSAGLLALYRRALLEPEARALLLRLAGELPFDRSCFQALRRLYKLAEFRHDHELLALLYQRVESTPARPQGDDESESPFCRPTRDYLRRRMPRLLEQLARRQPAHFVPLACEVLLQVRDGDPRFAPRTTRQSRYYRDARGKGQYRTSTQRYPAFADQLGLHYLLHANSLHYRRHRNGLSWIEANLQLPENTRPEAWPALWDQAPAQALRLLLGARAELVNDFALAQLSRHKAFCRALPLSDWLALVGRPYESTAAFALLALQERLHEPGVLEALLQSPLKGIRARALQALGGPEGKARLAGDLELAALLLCSPYTELQFFLRERLSALTDQAVALSERALSRIIRLTEAGAEGLESSLKSVQSFLTGPLAAMSPRTAIERLLQHADLRLQRLGASLLSASNFSYAELADLIPQLEQAGDPELRAAALRLLAKLDPDQRAAQSGVLLACLLEGEQALREAAHELLLGLREPAQQQALFAAIVPWLFRSQAEGPGEELLALVAGFEPIYASIDKHLLWRLLSAKSKLAQQAGSLIVITRRPAEFSLLQLVRLSRHASLSVRDWALAALKSDPRVDPLRGEDFAQVLEILDNPWDGSRQAAIAWLRSLAPATWTPAHTLAVCDQVYEDVQRFGRELVLSHFEAGQGADYLRQLSQHPSQQAQLFVSGFLAEYAAGNPELLLALRPYFESVLIQVNRGRVVKDRVVKLLRAAARESEPVAAMLAELLSAHSLTAVVADKARYLETLYELQQQDANVLTPLKLIAPRKAVV